MKKQFNLFAVFLIVAVMAACSAAESETLKKARVTQESVLKTQAEVDSMLDATIARYNDKLSKMSADTAMLQDSLRMSTFTTLQSKVSELGQMKSSVADWANNLKTLPSVEELAKGAENPFGAEAKDEDILKSLEESLKEIQGIKEKVISSSAI